MLLYNKTFTYILTTHQNLYSHILGIHSTIYIHNNRAKGVKVRDIAVAFRKSIPFFSGRIW